MRQRLDTLLVEAGLFPSREKARAAVMAGLVLEGTQRLDKPGTKLKALPDNLLIKGDLCPYVSRGGLKLAGALETFELDVQQLIALDVGASTGGFTDCLLQAGAQYVYAIDVGYNQLAWKIRQDPRVKVLEKVNARYLTPEDLYGAEDALADLIVMDVSFISIEKIFPVFKALVKPNARIVSLIKPQFEAPRSENKKGIVASPQAHLAVLEKIQAAAAQQGWFLHRIALSPITGKTGNREFLGLFEQSPPVNPPDLKAPTSLSMR